MSVPQKRFCLLSSTGGSVARRVYQEDPRFRASLALVVTDRDCGASEFARTNAIPLVIIREPDPIKFSDQLESVLSKDQIDYTFCFFTRILKGRICNQAGSIIFNFHPSLLPACPGMHGFEDSLASGALLIGSTVHVINEHMDDGAIVMQSAISARADGAEPKILRHRIFSEQCGQLLQTFQWASQDRLQVNEGTVRVAEADYSGATLRVPALEDETCLRLAHGEFR